jgi:hypothetical protein
MARIHRRGGRRCAGADVSRPRSVIERRSSDRTSSASAGGSPAHRRAHRSLRRG